MDLNSLDTFIAIAETGSFSEAGERLHLTQPAVSKRIAALEQQASTPACSTGSAARSISPRLAAPCCRAPTSCSTCSTTPAAR